MIEKIYYLVGPNGTGKTRALEHLCNQNSGFYIPKQRTNIGINNSFNEKTSKKFVTEYKERSKTNPDYVAMGLLRENAKLRFTVFSILSRKLGRNFSVEIVERTENFKITSGLNDESYTEVTIPRYGLEGESSGLRELLILLTFIHSGLSNKYFIDEPELSLHPEAQRFLKNEMIRLTEEKGCEFWIATHSPIFFSPESIKELQQATFFSDPQVSQGTKPDFENISDGQKRHLAKSLLRLDSEKWLLVHSKAVIFCEGFRDKAIFKTVFNKVGVDFSRHDYSLVETGGKDDFSTLFLLCNAINKKAFFIGDLDCLIESKLLDKYEENDIIKSELSGIATSIIDYISKNIRNYLGELTNSLLKLTDEQIEKADVKSIIFPNLNRIKSKTDNSKSLTLELINKHHSYIKSLFSEKKDKLKVDHLVSSTQKAIEILKKAGFFIIPTGTLETFYQSKPISPDNDKAKIELFDKELESLDKETVEVISLRYNILIDFIKSILTDSFDIKSYMKEELTKILSKVQVIILEERPLKIEILNSHSKYESLKVSDLITFTELDWENGHFNLKGISKGDFSPKFEFELNSNKGITSNEIITFK